MCAPAVPVSSILPLSLDKTLARILDEYYWPGVSSDVQQLCTACPECQKGSQAIQRKALLQSLPVISEPFSRIGMNLVGLLSRTVEQQTHLCSHGLRHQMA